MPDCMVPVTFGDNLVVKGKWYLDGPALFEVKGAHLANRSELEDGPVNPCRRYDMTLTHMFFFTLDGLSVDLVDRYSYIGPKKGSSC